MDSSNEQISRERLDRSLLSGVAWTGVARTFSQLSSWAVTVFLARLLSPADYGVVASAAVFFGFVRLLTEFGLGTAIVSKADVRPDQISQLGSVSIGLGILAWSGSAVASSLIARVLGVPELASVIPVMGISTALATASAVPAAVLQKRLDFRRLSRLDMVRSIMSALVALLLAVRGLGYWSLVIGEVAAACTYALALFASAPYRLSVPRIAELIDIIRFSSSVLVGRFAWYTYSTSDNVTVSRRLGKALLGQYSMAVTLTAMPAEKVSSLILGVTPGILARVHNDKEGMARYLLRITEALAILLFPASIGIALVAPDLVPIMMGNQWNGIVPVVQVLSIFIAVRSVMPLFSQVLVARQRAGTAMWFSIFAALTLPPLFYFATTRGLVAVASVWSVCFPVLAFLQARYAYIELGISHRRMFKTLAAPFLATVLMVIAVRSLQLAMPQTSQILRLIVAIAVGAMTYGAALAGLLWNRRDELRRLRSMLR